MWSRFTETVPVTRVESDEGSVKSILELCTFSYCEWYEEHPTCPYYVQYCQAAHNRLFVDLPVKAQRVCEKDAVTVAILRPLISSVAQYSKCIAHMHSLHSPSASTEVPVSLCREVLLSLMYKYDQEAWAEGKPRILAILKQDLEGEEAKRGRKGSEAGTAHLATPYAPSSLHPLHASAAGLPSPLSGCVCSLPCSVAVLLSQGELRLHHPLDP